MLGYGDIVEKTHKVKYIPDVDNAQRAEVYAGNMRCIDVVEGAAAVTGLRQDLKNGGRHERRRYEKQTSGISRGVPGTIVYYGRQ